MGILTALNKDAVKKVLDDLGLMTAVDVIPKDLKSDIQPVLDMSPRRFTTVARTATGTGTMYTTPTTSDRRKFYLTGWAMTTVEGTDPSVESTITVTLEDGRSVVVGVVACGATAGVSIGTGNLSCTFANPMPLAANTNVTFTAGGDANRAIIYGYEVDTN